MKSPILPLALLTTALSGPAFAQTAARSLDAVQTVVVLYAENRSFDSLYGRFTGANGLQNVTPEMARQLDRDGSVLPVLPKIWQGLTEQGVQPVIPEEKTANLPNRPFAIDDPNGFN